MNACSFFNIVFFYLIVLQNILYIPLNSSISTLFPLDLFPQKSDNIRIFIYVSVFLFTRFSRAFYYNAEPQSETMLFPA